MSQKDVFLESEGDRYYRRNKEGLTTTGARAVGDRVLASLGALALRPRAVLEIGCANGWRLALLQRMYGTACAGVDPSAEAVSEGMAAFPGIDLRRGTADALPFDERAFDVVIFGFCLYLCDRDALFRTAAEADRVLVDPGYLLIEDFHPPFPHQKPYAHNERITTYKMNYAALFSWNPAYKLVSQVLADHLGRPAATEPDDRVSVSVLRKDERCAYPHDPFKPAT